MMKKERDPFTNKPPNFCDDKDTVYENRTHTLAFSQTQERVSVSLSLSDVLFFFVFIENLMRKCLHFFPNTKREKSEGVKERARFVVFF